jgi:hypothetical protein
LAKCRISCAQVRPDGQVPTVERISQRRSLVLLPSGAATQVVPSMVQFGAATPVVSPVAQTVRCQNVAGWNRMLARHCRPDATVGLLLAADRSVGPLPPQLQAADQGL